jgi:hypothetical protein
MLSLLALLVGCVGNCEFSSFWFPFVVGSLDHYSIREFTSPSFPVYMYDGEGNYKVLTVEEVSFFYISSSLC